MTAYDTREVAEDRFVLVAGAGRPSVDLLPPEVRESRRVRRLRQLAAGGALVAVGAVAAAGGLLSSRVAEAQAEVDDSRARGTALARASAQHAAVPRTEAAITQAEAVRASALGGEVLWSTVLSGLAERLPAGAWLTAVSVAPTDPAATAATPTDPAATGAPATTAPGSLATVTVEGRGLGHPVAAEWLDAVQAQPGTAGHALLGSARVEGESQEVVSFTGSFGVTDEALSHRHDASGG